MIEELECKKEYGKGGRERERVNRRRMACTTGNCRERERERERGGEREITEEE